MLDLDIAIITAVIGFFLGFMNHYLEKWCPSSFLYILTALLGIGWIVYVFLDQGFLKTTIAISLIIVSYFNYPSPEKNGKNSQEIIYELNKKDAREIVLHKNKDRILLDLLFSGLFMSISIFYFLFGPESSLELFLLFGLIALVSGMIKRMRIFHSLRFFYEKEENALYAVSSMETKKYPLNELSEISIQSRPDILKLFELFSMFSPNTDYTTSMGRTWKLSFLGEKVYFTPEPSEFIEFLSVDETKKVEEIEVKPFYHKDNWKRLLGKGYFAVTVKGVGAYAVLITFLTLIGANPYITTIVALLFWLFNLWISDRVLKMALDMKELDDPDLIASVNKVFSRAGLSHVKVYSTESTDYNGFAAGANIGRSLVALTTETLKLPRDAIEGILAHEAVHVKKRDVLIGQLARIILIGIIIAGVFFVHETIPDLLVYFALTVVILLFPVSYSFLTQWMEVRADHLGATLLDGGNAQMAKSLSNLYEFQEKAMDSYIGYDVVPKGEEKTEVAVEESNEKTYSLERESWFFRFLEFQFMSHPPMYWRVHSLRSTETGWNMGKIILWWNSRLRESLPDWKRKKANDQTTTKISN